MFERFRGKTAAATAAALLAALGVGGIAAAQNGSTSPPAQTKAPSSSQSSTAPSSAATEVPGQESNAPENSAGDPDNVQQGDTAITGKAAATADVPTAGDTPDTRSADVPTAGDTPDTGSAAEAPGSEVAGSDGPGGHADEPGNPNADHQATGVE
jgi:hypothetical protein